MPQRGKLVIAGMLLMAILAATFAWWHQYERGVRVLSVWGPEHARRIRLASDCELWRLEPDSRSSALNSANSLAVGGTPWRISRRVPVSGAPGFVHARQALIQDASHDWSASRSGEQPRWSYALCFRDAAGQTVLVFDQHAHRMCLVDDPRAVSRLIDISPGLVTFFEEQLRRAGKGP